MGGVVEPLMRSATLFILQKTVNHIELMRPLSHIWTFIEMRNNTK